MSVIYSYPAYLIRFSVSFSIGQGIPTRPYSHRMLTKLRYTPNIIHS